MRVKTIGNKNQSWPEVSSHKDLATMSAFQLENGKGPYWLVRAVPSPPGTSQYGRERTAGRPWWWGERGNMQAITHPAKYQKSRWSHPYKAPGMLTSGHSVGEAGGRTMLKGPLNHQWRCRYQGWLTWKTETVCHWMSCVSPLSLVILRKFMRGLTEQETPS